MKLVNRKIEEHVLIVIMRKFMIRIMTPVVFYKMLINKNIQ